MPEKVLYAHLRPAEFRHRLAEAPIAYLPLGTLEWHGEHLPLGSDGLQSQGFFVELARRAGGIVLPMLFVGPDRKTERAGRRFYGMDTWEGFPEGQPRQLDGSAYWVDEELFTELLESILEQLRRAGFRIVVAHGHGPSTVLFRRNIEQWSERFGLRLFACWREDESDGLGIQTDHAAANETSLVMALHADLVAMENLPADPDVWPVAVGGEDPRTHASPQKGKQAIERQAERMAAMLWQTLAEIDAQG
ncbi:MAG: creatininase family protein [Candidatus Brocadiaceae bacterium]|jgi:creatinine amidohydrolase